MNDPAGLGRILVSRSDADNEKVTMRLIGSIGLSDLKWIIVREICGTLNTYLLSSYLISSYFILSTFFGLFHMTGFYVAHISAHGYRSVRSYYRIFESDRYVLLYLHRMNRAHQMTKLNPPFSFYILHFFVKM